MHDLGVLGVLGVGNGDGNARRVLLGLDIYHR